MILAKTITETWWGQSPVGTGMLGGSTGKWAELVQVPEAARLDLERNVAPCGGIGWGRIELC